MKLGQRVRFSVDYVKSGEYVDIDKATEEQLDSTVTLTAYKPRKHEPPKVGFICGRRSYAVTKYLEYVPSEDYDDKFVSVGQDYESFYLVACTLSGFYKVKPEDLEVIE